MRTKLSLTFATALTMAALVSNSEVATADPSKNLVVEGTVTTITQIANDPKPWLVKVKVTKVVSGELSSKTFEFAVHSPSRAGLQKRRSYTIEATWDGKSYAVDELQWLRPKAKAPPVPAAPATPSR
jgi:hypothetical protein